MLYARSFQWTPDQVDNLPMRLEPWILPIHGELEAEMARRQDAMMKQAQKAR